MGGERVRECCQLVQEGKERARANQYCKMLSEAAGFFSCATPRSTLTCFVTGFSHTRKADMKIQFLAAPEHKHFGLESAHERAFGLIEAVKRRIPGSIIQQIQSLR